VQDLFNSLAFIFFCFHEHSADVIDGVRKPWIEAAQ
jgi:hypothetical protein